MKTYKQEDVDSFPVVEGVKQCPPGAYSDCNFSSTPCSYCSFESGGNFGSSCSFGSSCEFGRNCRFDSSCKFGSYCSFVRNCNLGRNCSFDSSCKFGSYCDFDSGCNFGSSCSFGRCCDFDSGCNFGSYCSFGINCNFGSDCNFGSYCSFEGYKARTTNPFIALDRAGSENRKTYIFDFEKGLYVRSGCFFGTLQQFRDKVLQDDKTPEKTRVKTLVYLGFANLACAQFNRMEDVQ